MPFSKFLFGIIDSKLPFLFSDVKYVSAVGHTQRMPFWGSYSSCILMKRTLIIFNATVMVVGAEKSTRIIFALKHPWHLTFLDFHCREDGQLFVMENTRTLSGGIKAKSLGYLKVMLKVDFGLRPSRGYQNIRPNLLGGSITERLLLWNWNFITVWFISNVYNCIASAQLVFFFFLIFTWTQ